MRTMPARVPKNMKLPGHMGDVRVTVSALEVVDVLLEDNLVLVRGAVPGAKQGLLSITPRNDGLEGRPDLKRADEKVVEEVKAEGATEEKAAETETPTATEEKAEAVEEKQETKTKE